MGCYDSAHLYSCTLDSLSLHSKLFHMRQFDIGASLTWFSGTHDFVIFLFCKTLFIQILRI